MRIRFHEPADVDLGGTDLAAADLYTDGDPHRVWHALRSRHPMFWHRGTVQPGFWVVTRHADVRRVLRDHAAFTSERGTALDMIGTPDPAAGRMMHATDPPRHRWFRVPIEQPLSARSVERHRPMVRELARAACAPARNATAWDAATAITRLPVAVMASLMDLPRADVEFLRDVAYASVAPADPHYRVGSPPQTLQWAHSAVADYFTRWIRDRRHSSGTDLLSQLIAMDIAGRRPSDDEVVLNCFSLLVGGVVTTAQVVSGALLALVEQGRGEGHWPSAPTTSIVEEALRWSSPTTHFMRSARHDLTLHDAHVRTGEPVTAWIASANRDGAVFDRPYAFDPHRRPNRHIAFGTGPHRCVGRHLARAVLRETFEELRTAVSSFRLAGDPVHLRSNLIAGLVRLPVEIRPRRAGREP